MLNHRQWHYGEIAGVLLFFDFTPAAQELVNSLNRFHADECIALQSGIVPIRSTDRLTVSAMQASYNLYSLKLFWAPLSTLYPPFLHLHTHTPTLTLTNSLTNTRTHARTHSHLFPLNSRAISDSSRIHSNYWIVIFQKPS